jgi:hypothetical protein
MAANKRTPEARELDRAKMVEMLRRGASRTKIAKALGVSASQITYDWKVVIRQVRADQSANVKDIVARKLAELEEVKWEAWQAWERSKQPSHKRVVETEPERACPDCEGRGVWTEGPDHKPCRTCEGTGKVGGVDPIKVVETTEQRCGDSQYLAVIRSCVADERRLLGLDAEKDTVLTGSGSGGLTFCQALAQLPPGPVPDPAEEAISRVLALPAPAKEQEVSELTTEAGPVPPGGDRLA